ncbi:sugar efflux transporter [Nitzschia inconspicua]|uniref:Sugar efflux transporter n=1 Tax=Nitzschia inconspicua TaxID=303405 RepID=A0A9K3LBN3_9STRA|nr:sugar efflux transporter [Nitzschia inconspicua]
MASYDFILQVIFPTVGVLTSTFMNFAPFRAVLQAARKGTLEDLNPTPWCLMLGNCCGWLAYSFLLQNVYVFLPNASGFLLAIWLNIQAIKIQYENHRSAELQTGIIKALEEVERSKNQTMNKESFTHIVEQVIVENSAPTVDMIDPITTAPIDKDGDGYSNSHKLSSTFTMGVYHSINNSESEGARANGDEGDDNDGDFVEIESSDRALSFLGSGTIHEAAENVMDYASFVWEIAAQRSPAPASHELMVLAMSGFWLCIFTMVVFTESVWDEETRILILGITVNINLIFFYGAPLSKIAVVLETRCSKMIHVPTMICSLVNGTLWLVYGLGVEDYVIAIPNGLGGSYRCFCA